MASFRSGALPARGRVCRKELVFVRATAPCGETTQRVDTPKEGAAFTGDRGTGSPALRIPSAAKELLGAVLNPFAGLLHVLAEAVGRVAADADDGQERGDKEQKNETLNPRDLICFHGEIIQPGIRAGTMGCSPHLRFWSGVILVIPHPSVADHAMVAAVRAGRPLWRASEGSPRG